MQIQNNYSTNYKQNPNFGVVLVRDLQVGKTYFINSFHHDPKLRGTKRIYTVVENYWIVLIK